MNIQNFLDSLPSNFRHEKSFFVKQNLSDLKILGTLSDFEVNEIQRNSPLCTTNNLKKIRAIAIFIIELSISPSEAYLLLHSGISSIKTLSLLTPFELEHKIRRLERNLRVKTETKITFALLKEWIKRAKQICESF